MRRRIPAGALLTTLFILMVLLVSCGKIGDPRPGKAARMEKEPPLALSETTPAPVKAPPVPTEVPRATMDEAPPPEIITPPALAEPLPPEKATPSTVDEALPPGEKVTPPAPEELPPVAEVTPPALESPPVPTEVPRATMDEAPPTEMITPPALAEPLPTEKATPPTVDEALPPGEKVTPPTPEAPRPAKVAPPPPKAPPPPVKLTRPPKKAPRAPSKITVPLSLDQSECGVILMWDLNAYKTLPDLVRIYRSDVSGDGCEDCPGEGRVVAELDRAKLAYLREYDGSFVYIDRTVRQNFVYRYAIVVCTDRGGCSETSGEVEIEFTYTMDGCP